jgi:cystathionine beta-lyase/cystathionine gamma-synthase
MASTFKQFSPGNHLAFDYGRINNPTRSTIEDTLASLEKAKYGVAFASGMAAISSLSFLLKSGDHIVTLVTKTIKHQSHTHTHIFTIFVCYLKENVYGGTNIYFKQLLTQFGIETTFVDMLDLVETEKAFRPNTAVYMNSFFF